MTMVLVSSGCQPLWLSPKLDTHFGIADCIQPETLRCAFEHARSKNMRVKGVIVVSPTYFGVLAPIAALAQVCHDHGVPLLVDEAHGSHFGTHPGLPPGALAEGADCVMHSTHKVRAGRGLSCIFSSLPYTHHLCIDHWRHTPSSMACTGLVCHDPGCYAAPQGDAPRPRQDLEMPASRPGDRIGFRRRQGMRFMIERAYCMD